MNEIRDKIICRTKIIIALVYGCNNLGMSLVEIDRYEQTTKHIIDRIGDGCLRIKWPNQQCQSTEEISSVRFQRFLVTSQTYGKTYKEERCWIGFLKDLDAKLYQSGGAVKSLCAVGKSVCESLLLASTLFADWSQQLDVTTTYRVD